MSRLTPMGRFWLGITMFIAGALSHSYEGAFLVLIFSSVIGSVDLMSDQMTLWLEKKKDKKHKEAFTVIGIGGAKGAGKSVAAKYFEKECGYYHTFFAKALKTACGDVFGLTWEVMEDQTLKETPFPEKRIMVPHRIHQLVKAVKPFYPGEITVEQVSKMVKVGSFKEFETPRQILQFVGTELFRDCVHEDFHALCVKKELEEQYDVFGYKKFVISDARFPNEREFIKEVWGGYTLLIDTPEEDKPKKKDAHASENSLGSATDYDCVIVNRKTRFEDLYDDLRSFLVVMHSDRAQRV